MKIIFMGTPEFAVGALEAIIEAGHQVVLIVTQPDKPKGRGKEMQISPVKACALEHDIPVFQPAKIKEAEAVETLRGYDADAYVVAAFGQILSEEILNMPKFGCINIHASLLPKYRGSAPIQRAILDGEEETGVTIMKMDKGVDTGDMLMQSVVPIDVKETGDSLHDKLAAAGAKLIVEALPKLESGDITPVKQNDADACYAGMLDKSMGRIDWGKDAVQIERLVRGLNSWPGTYTFYNGRVLKIWESEVCGVEAAKTESAGIGTYSCGTVSETETSGVAVPGTVTAVSKDAIYVLTGKDALKITQVQLEGKKRMAVKEFLLGCRIKAGEIFRQA